MPTDVVQNFDLTFCQVWYDGDAVYATHPDHVKNKVGYLQGDYVKLYLRKNHFLRRRVQKYRMRGFTTVLHPVAVSQLVPTDLLGPFDLSRNYGISDSAELKSLRCGTGRMGRLRTAEFYDSWARRYALYSLVQQTTESDDFEDTLNDGWAGFMGLTVFSLYPDTCIKIPHRYRRDATKCDDLKISYKSNVEQSNTIFTGLNHPLGRLDPLDGYDSDDLGETPEERKATFMKLDGDLKGLLDPPRESTSKEIGKNLLEEYFKLRTTVNRYEYKDLSIPYADALKRFLTELGYNCLARDEDDTEEQKDAEEFNTEQKEAEEEPAPNNGALIPPGFFGNPNEGLLGGKKKRFAKSRKRKHRKYKQ
jgi:hypothetical protein